MARKVDDLIKKLEEHRGKDIQFAAGPEDDGRLVISLFVEESDRTLIPIIEVPLPIILLDFAIDHNYRGAN